MSSKKTGAPVPAIGAFEVTNVTRYPGGPTVPPILRSSDVVNGNGPPPPPGGPPMLTTAVAVAAPAAAPSSSASSSRIVFLSASPFESHWRQRNTALAPLERLVTRTWSRCQPLQSPESSCDTSSCCMRPTSARPRTTNASSAPRANAPPGVQPPMRGRLPLGAAASASDMSGVRPVEPWMPKRLKKTCALVPAWRRSLVFTSIWGGRRGGDAACKVPDA
eukprot:354873-Chlamydomonas_euryale.AAC.6